MNDTQAAQRWDAIVIGAGMGGLVCAAYLAVSGLRVLVLEQHDVAGGNSHVFRRRRTYEFDVGVHYLGDCGPDGLLPAIFAGLGAGDRVRFREMDPDGYDRLVLPGLTVDVPSGRTRFRERLKQALPGDAAALDRFLDITSAIGDEMRWTMLADEEPSPVELARHNATTAQWGRKPLTALFDFCELSTVARTVLAAQGLNFGMGPEQISVSMHAAVTDHYLRGSYYPVGGSQMMAAALVEVLESHGGELRTRARAERILIAEGRAHGVLLGNGQVLDAPRVVSNADYSRTVLELAGAEHFPAGMVNRTRTAELALPMAVTYVALDTDLGDRRNANLLWHRDPDIGATYRALETGDWDEIPMLFISFSHLKDPDSRSICPEGQANFQVMSLCPPGYQRWGVDGGPTDGERYRRNPGYLKVKNDLTEAMLDGAEQALGPFREHITHLETATPLTQERYTRSTRGDSFGMTSWGGSRNRPDVKTTVDGLYVVGQNTRYGTGIAGVAMSGIACAGKILGRRLLPEVYRGAELGDPAALPDRGPDWDPLRVSRGTARRSSKGLAQIAGRRAVNTT